MTRVLSGVVLAAAALAAIVLLPVSALRWVACGIAALAAHEYVTVAGAGPARGIPLLIPMVVAACLLSSGFGFTVDPMAVAVAAFAWVAVEVLFLGRSIQLAGVALFAPIYIGVPLGMLVVIQATFGWQATLLLIATIVVSDSAQYYSGRTLGRRPLAPSISPKKTIEGAVGGVLFGTIFVAVAGPRVLPAVPAPWILVGLTMVVLGICGDLFESRLKRAAGVKDSSSLIPGHGGVLDRIDALLFAIPAFYLFLRAAA
jgi:phosphatidate cytidylyltransferase